MGPHGISENGVLSVIVLRAVVLRWVRIVLLLLLLRHVHVHLPGPVLHMLDKRLYGSNTVNLMSIKVSHVVVGHHAWLLATLGLYFVSRRVWSGEVQVRVTSGVQHAQISVFRCIKMSFRVVVLSRVWSVAHFWTQKLGYKAVRRISAVVRSAAAVW